MISIIKIKVIFTGGTINSEASENGITVNGDNSAQKQLIENFYKNYDCNDVKFDISQPINISSENMTIDNWNSILNELKNTNIFKYDGIIIAHGTDTLAYTASILSIMLSGIEIPVVLVSSNYILSDKRTNGNDNFLNAVCFIKEKKFCGVYVIYKNKNDKSIVYLGSRIKQCASITNEFSSANGVDFGEITNKHFSPIINKNNPDATEIQKIIFPENLLLYSIPMLKPCVMLIFPYTGIDYKNFLPSTPIKAVLHSLYHASTAPTISDSKNSNSILYLNKICKSKGIDLYISPLISSSAESYSTTNEITATGVNSLFDISIEMSYAKLIAAYSTDDYKIRKFILNNNIFFEKS